MQTIGVLLPRSTYYTGLSFDLFEGIRSSFKVLGNNDIRIVTENIGFGTDKQMCYKSAEQLIMHENASVVFAYIGHRMAQVLRPLFTAANKLLIVLDAGANFPKEWPDSPHIIYHSLHNAFGSWLSGKRAAADGYKSSGLITGYYDGGYLHTWGMASGFSASGGEMIFNHATGYSKDDFSMIPLKEFVAENPESALLSIFSGDYVQWYFQDLKNVFGEKKLPVYLPPFGLEETMLKDATYPGYEVKGVASWSQELDNEENNKFKEAIISAGRTPNLFSLLGWEAAIIAEKVIDLQKEFTSSAAVSSEITSGFSFESPRGTIRFHQDSKHSIGPFYNALIEEDGTGKCALKIESVIEESFSEYNEFVQLPTENAISGWYNSYTCI